MGERIEHDKQISVTRKADGTIVHSSIEITRVSSSSQCFDPRTCCDAEERALIEAVRDYLRPQVAPQCLLRRLRTFMDETTADLKHDDPQT